MQAGECSSTLEHATCATPSTAGLRPSHSAAKPRCQSRPPTCRLMVPCTSQFSQPPSLFSTHEIFSSTAMNTGSLGGGGPAASTAPVGREGEAARVRGGGCLRRGWAPAGGCGEDSHNFRNRWEAPAPWAQPQPAALPSPRQCSKLRSAREQRAPAAAAAGCGTSSTCSPSALSDSRKSRPPLALPSCSDRRDRRRQHVSK